MARGRPDYWYSYLPGKTVFAPNQSQWGQYSAVLFSAGATATPIDYTVPADTILVVDSGYLSISHPRDYHAYVDIDGITKMRLFFLGYQNLPFSTNGLFEVQSGERVRLRVFGNNDFSAYVYAGFFGYEETRAE